MLSSLSEAEELSCLKSSEFLLTTDGIERSEEEEGSLSFLMGIFISGLLLLPSSWVSFWAGIYTVATSFNKGTFLGYKSSL